ncbi:Ig-like domain-containing protein [Kitasatospora sp. NPDC089913]|uniref:Ig-like domain-containing protein n=1 Tax=Kitasatospora sp. NPDC089913 TaxID=3364080 RepID=UPI00382A2BEE
MNGSGVSGRTYNGTQLQSFRIVKQADGSWGIRAFYLDRTFPQEPQARDAAAATSQGRAVDVDVLANASGTGTTQPLDLTATGTSKPANGTAAIVGGKVRYTPAAGFTGCDTLTYTVRDIFGRQSTATARVAVADVGNVVAQPVSGTALTVSGALVTGSAFQDGNAAQRFTLAPRGDRSSGAVTTTAYNGTQPQSLELVDLGDGTYALLTYYGSTQVPQTPVARTTAGATVQGGVTTVDVLATPPAPAAPTAGA